MSSGFRATNTKTQLFFHPPPSSSSFLSGVWNVCSYFVCMIPPVTFELRAVSEVRVFVLNLSSISLWMKESQKSVECKKKSQQVFFFPCLISHCQSCNFYEARILKCIKMLSKSCKNMQLDNSLFLELVHMMSLTCAARVGKKTQSQSELCRWD